MSETQGRAVGDDGGGAFGAVILDFDGLIVDTETPIFDEWRREFSEWGADLTLGDWQYALGTRGGIDPCALLQERSGRPVDREVVVERVRVRNRLRCEQQPVLPGVAEVLRDARLAGLGTAVASSSSLAWVEGWLEHHALGSSFDVVCAADHVARVKPAPDLFLLAAARLGVEPRRCVVFEDSPNGIVAARAAGMRCVAVPNAVTRPLPLPDPDLVVRSLADCSLRDLLARLAAS